MPKLTWSASARKDLIRLYDFLEPINKPAAQKAFLTIVRSGRALQDYPEKGAAWQEDPTFREWKIRHGQNGYILRYKLTEDQITIIRVWHMREQR
jgi:plasmid stabilization system protein ParE